MRVGLDRRRRRAWLVLSMICFAAGLLAGSVWLNRRLGWDAPHATEYVPPATTPVTGSRWYWQYSQWNQGEVPPQP